MATQLETTGALERKLAMSVPVAEINRQVVDRLRKLSRNVKMPGFRPGKVPMKMIEQSYGPQVHAEVLGDAVSRAFSEAVDEHKLRVAGQPTIERRESAAEHELGFTATFDGGIQNGGGTTHLFRNAGIFTKSAGAGTLVIDIPFTNTSTGIVNIDSGTLRPGSGFFPFTNEGTVNLAAGTTLRTDAATFNFNAGTTLAGSGTLPPVEPPVLLEINRKSCAPRFCSTLIE